MLAARLCEYSGDKAPAFAVIFEYLHAATLLHDDLVDEATVRRGQPVANSVWDTATAVLTGDFLLARSLSLAADTGNVDVIRTIARITEMMSQGEIQQLQRKGQLDLTEAVVEVSRVGTTPRRRAATARRFHATLAAAFVEAARTRQTKGSLQSEDAAASREQGGP